MEKIDGAWPKNCLQRAFVAGAKWWQFYGGGSTAFPYEVEQMEQEAIKRYGEPKDVDALLSDVQALVEAAKPFAKLLQKHNDNGHHTKPIFAINDALLTLGDLRKIKQAIAAVERHLEGLNAK